MGQQTTKICPAIETLGCDGCPDGYEVGQNSSCETESAFCANIKNNKVTTYLSDIKEQRLANQEKTKKLVDVFKFLNTKNEEIRNLANAASINATIASNEEQFWIKTEQYFNECGKALQICNASLPTTNGEILLLEKYIPNATAAWTTTGLPEFFKALENDYTTCVQKEAKTQGLCDGTCDRVWTKIINDDSTFTTLGEGIHNKCVGSAGNKHRNTLTSLKDVVNSGYDYVASANDVVNYDYMTRDNLAFGKDTLQSSTGWRGKASRAVDTIDSTAWADNGCTHTAHTNGHQWWHVDLGQPKLVQTVVIANRQDGTTKNRLANAKVCVGEREESESNDDAGLTCMEIPIGSTGPSIVVKFDPPQSGQYVAVKHQNQYITLCDVKVYGPPSLMPRA